MKRTTAAAVVIVLLLAASGFWYWQTRNARLERPLFPAPGSVAEDFQLHKVQGGEAVRLKDFRGKKAVLLNFWASWSSFSAKEMADLAELQKAGGAEVAVLAVNRAEPGSVAQKFAKDHMLGDAYPLLLDPDDAIFKAYKGFAMPTSYYIDKRGIIRAVKNGPLTLEEMRDWVKLFSAL